MLEELKQVHQAGMQDGLEAAARAFEHPALFGVTLNGLQVAEMLRAMKAQPTDPTRP